MRRLVANWPRTVFPVAVPAVIFLSCQLQTTHKETQSMSLIVSQKLCPLQWGGGGELEEAVPENSNILNVLMHALHTKFSLFYLLEQPTKQFELQFAN